MTTPLTPEKILQTGLAFWPAKTLLSAIEMGVFTELARGAEGFEALRGRLGLHPRSARDFLDTLVASVSWPARAMPTATRPRRTSSSTGGSPPTSAASWRWPTTGSTRSGDI